MMLDLHGLHIRLFTGMDCYPADPVMPEGTPVDLVWHRHIADTLPPGNNGEAQRRSGPGGEWLDLTYGPGDGQCHCTFSLSPDGRQVVSRSLAQVPAADLMTLFAEPVMRSVFRRHGMLSLHGAALAHGGQAVLLLGDKGAGKSTLAAALLRAGWQMLTDDLARVIARDKTWLVTPGFAQLKMTAQTATAMGHELAVMARRWTAPQAGSDAAVNKYVVNLPPAPAPLPLRAICILAPLPPHADEPSLTALPPDQSARAVLANISDDPADPGALLPPALLAQAFAMIGQVPVYRLAVPRRFAALDQATDLLAALCETLAPHQKAGLPS